MKNNWFAISLAGFCAGAVNGLFGAAGGMVLVPLLTKFTALTDEEIFPSSISIILPICLISLIFTAMTSGLDYASALPYLIGGGIGGIGAGFWGRKIPTIWLHRILGIFILWGGIRYLW